MNYRYSVLGLLGALGVNFGTGAAIPEYQDINFKIDAPTGKAGRFTLFGIGGISDIEFLGSESEEPDLFNDEGEDLRAGSKTGILGFTHTYFFNQQTSQKIIASASAVNSYFEVDSLSIVDGTPTRTSEGDDNQFKYTLGYRINHKFNAKNKILAGITSEVYDFKILQQALYSDGAYLPTVAFEGTTVLMQSFISWQHRFNDKLTLNSGLHSQYLTFNNSYNFEPRLGIRYAFKNNQSVSAGLTLHSQMQPISSYFVQTRMPDGSVEETNRDLDFYKSSHFVVGYDNMLGDNFRIKVEAYTQYIYDAAVETRPSSFSMLNTGADFGIPENDSLINEGNGFNYGLELTVEKFLSKGYYLLFTASAFQSKYAGSDEVWRSTAFNSNYVFNLLAGKEWKFGRGHSFAVDGKVAVAGGGRYTEIDLEASREKGYEVRKNDEAFEQQYKTYFRPDIKFTYSHEGKKITQRFSVDLQNFINYQNIFSIDYNNRTGELDETYQIGFFPDVTYRILF